MKSKQNPNFVYAYNRNTFQKFNKLKRHKEMCNKYLKLHPNRKIYRLYKI